MGQRLAPQVAQMASQFPQQNEEVGRRQAEARQAAIRSAVAGAARRGPVARQTLGQTAAQSVQQQAQPRLQAQARTMEQQGQLAQVQLQQEGTSKQSELQRRNTQLQQQHRLAVTSLNQLQQGLGDKMVSRETQFQKDQMGRTLFTERQLMDYKLASVRRREDLAQYEQAVTQASQLRMQALKTSHAIITQALQQQFAQDEQTKDLRQTERLHAARKTIEEKMAAEQARQAERAARFQATGKIVGTVVGGVVGGVAGVFVGGVGAVPGAMAGAAAGGAIGSAGGGLLASSTAPKKEGYSAQRMGVGTSQAQSEIGASTYGANR